ncbi:hypothetical protein ABE28_009020 [Peribacillus muralis]|uniref:Uncharacterized protein n=1 Tax=Peribacillus muralis TaxID=264697 RepID=A0A1B3XMR5_9BACI|nr:hypothetical protein [Peribacillus muralis]AOH54493.1 hypothetical protein ABE28_009020 [Peribacillus muralis]
MSSESLFIENLIKNIMLQIHTNLPARVISYDGSTKPPEADIEILFMSKSKSGELSKYPLVQSVPCLRHVGPLIKGDVIQVAVAERAMDELQNVPFDPGMRRMFNLNDAVVIGVFDL